MFHKLDGLLWSRTGTCVPEQSFGRLSCFLNKKGGYMQDHAQLNPTVCLKSDIRCSLAIITPSCLVKATMTRLFTEMRKWLRLVHSRRCCWRGGSGTGILGSFYHCRPPLHPQSACSQRRRCHWTHTVTGSSPFLCSGHYQTRCGLKNKRKPAVREVWNTEFPLKCPDLWVPQLQKV